jgi:hypothetical protein
VDAPLLSPHELIRPWRRATLVATAVAALELVLLIGTAGVLLAKPLARKVQHRAEAKAFSPVKTKLPIPKTVAVGMPRLARQETGVFVLNGNGRAGAAAAAAHKLQGIGYVVSGTGNAQRVDYATTVVMFRPGFRPEAARLARDLHLKAVGPLDGMSVGALRGAHLAVILGAGKPL